MSTQRDLEKLSALMDGQAGELETRQILRDLDDEASAVWSRYHLVQDLLQGHQVCQVPSGFSEQLASAIASEPVTARNRWMAPMARLAVAASVAAATVVGWQYWSTAGVAGAGGGMTVAVSSPQAANMATVSQQPMLQRPLGRTSLVADDFGRSEQASPVAVRQLPLQRQINAMLVRHSEFASRHSTQGMMPYVRLVSMDADGAQR